MPIVLDSGCSVSVTPFKEDFAGGINGRPLDVIVPGALWVPSMDLQILSLDQWARSPTRKGTDKCKDYAHMVTTPDEDRSTVFINKNRKRFAIPHSNGLAKCRCSYPNAPMKVKSHFCSEEYDCCHYIYWFRGFNYCIRQQVITWYASWELQ